MSYKAYVPQTPTVYRFEEAAKVLQWALGQARGKTPSVDALAVFLAKMRLESGNFKFCYNHNPGNIKHPADPDAPGMLTLYPCNEILTRNGKPVVVWFSKVAELTGKGGTPVGQIYDEPPGHPQSRFVANANIYAGMDHYVQFLLRPSYRGAFEAAWSGVPERFSHALKAANYYTANEDQYTATVVKLFSECRAKLQGMPHEPVELPGDGSFSDWLEWSHVRAEIIGQSWERTQAAVDQIRADAKKQLAETE